MSNDSCDLDTYLCSDKGLLLPIINEYTWDRGARASLYLIGLLYSFLGVAIIADIFMRSIEMITSRRHKVKVADPDTDSGFKEIEVLSWNGTVANLTLMALGSSAPEILLSVIEIVGNKFEAGELGPSTIVGSAAFNFLVIVGVCVIIIPDGEVRKIRYLKVFATTTIFSVFAYVWLIIILVVITPDFLDLWEAFLTLLMFPLLIVLAYMADRDICGKPRHDDEDAEQSMDEETDPEAKAKQTIQDVIKSASKYPGIKEEEVARLAAYQVASEQPHSLGWYRRNAIGGFSGGVKLQPVLNEKQQDIFERILSGESAENDPHLETITGGQRAIIEFAAESACVLEREGEVTLTIMRHGNINNRVIYHVNTIDGTAEAGSDYIAIDETFVFEPKVTSKKLKITIIDDNQWELDEMFHVRLTVELKQNAVVGKRSLCCVVILNDDNPGEINLAGPSLVFKESVGTAAVKINRTDGCDGEVSVAWKTKDMTAINGRDYIGGEGTLVFRHGEVSKVLEIPIKDDKEFEKDEHFEISLKSTTGGAKIGKVNRTIVTILNDDEYQGVVCRVTDLANLNLDSMRVNAYTWGRQFKEAMNVNGGDIENARWYDYILHFLSFVWKVVFAFVPPPTIWGGWLAFFVALALIGLLTAIVGDLAGIFGCLIGLKDSVTAITLVALGTSLPDLFASKQAATNEKYADSSIGNVTGSNSVNVFLGLGVPWVLATIYWGIKGKSFYVPAGSLGFSVTVYTILSSVCGVAIIIMRRVLKATGQAELGGPKMTKIITGIMLMLLWVTYVLIASFQAYDYIPSF